MPKCFLPLCYWSESFALERRFIRYSRRYRDYKETVSCRQVFGSSPSGDMNEKFWDILAFTQQVSRLMVSEIRRRASNQSTETASCAIVKFLEIENSEESSNGWMLLSALNLLAAGDTSLIQVN